MSQKLAVSAAFYPVSPRKDTNVAPRDQGNSAISTSTGNMQTPTRGISLLPVELLQRTFELHTLVNLGSPYVLRRVCRHWLAIVDNTTTLRTRLYFGARFLRREEMVVCYSLGRLLQAIQRTQNFQHELTIAAPGEPKADPTRLRDDDAKWIEFVNSGTSRCRRLTIITKNNPPWFQSSLENCNLPELCELYIGLATTRLKNTKFLDAIQRSSRHLRDLTVNSDIIPELPKFPLLLRRLTRLSLNGFRTFLPQELWEHLIHLEHLTVSNENQLRGHEKVTLPSLSHVKIGIPPRQVTLRPLAMYCQITSLTITLDASPLAFALVRQRSSVKMLRLQHLEIHSNWSPICTIEAPTLSVLVLRGARPTGGQLLRPEDRIICRPRTLHIDMGKNIIDVHLARRLGECWANTEALYLKYIVADSSPSFILRTALEGSALDAPVCPHLKIIDIVMPPPILNAGIRRKNTLQELRRMAQIRRSRNILEGGHCGWFTAFPPSHQKTMEEASRDWWNIEWFKLLE